MSLSLALLLRLALLGALGLASASPPEPSVPPRVLILGDGTHRQALQAARSALAGRVELVIPRRVVAAHTGAALERFDELQADGDWDLIYFNWGLGDLVYRDPRTREERNLARSAGGVRTTSPERYRSQLAQLVDRLSAQGAPLLFATTTPTLTLKNGHTPCEELFDAGAELEYNRIALELMRAREVAVLDLHAFCMRAFEGETHPPFLDYAKVLSRDAEKTDLHTPIVDAVLQALGLEDAPDPEAEEPDEPAEPEQGPP